MLLPGGRLQSPNLNQPKMPGQAIMVGRGEKQGEDEGRKEQKNQKKEGERESRRGAGSGELIICRND